jgi:LemA protein
MNTYLILLIIFLIVSIIALIFYSTYTKLKKYKEKMDKAEGIIDNELNKKLDLIININGEIKKLTGKKDYLKDYISLKDMIITNIEKDWKLDEAEKLINNLFSDFKELNKNDKFKKLLTNLRDIDEVLTSAKNMFNQNAIESNKYIKTFPNNIVAKLTNCKIRSYYNNKNEDMENF